MKLQVIKRVVITVVVAAMAAVPGHSAPGRTVSSPDGRITVAVETDSKGRLYYRVDRDGNPILLKSRLGISCKDVPDMAEGFSVSRCTYAGTDSCWSPIWGEESSIRDHHNEMRLELVQKRAAPGRKIAVVFRVFDDGIGFRYEFPRQKSLGDFIIDDELTEFAFAGNHESWSLPAQGIRFYEGLFRRLPLDSIGTASTPVTIRTATGLHMALHEAALTDYAAMNVTATPGSSLLRADLTPWANGDRVRVTSVRVSPWRTLIIADNAGDMALSRIMLNLNEPCAVPDAAEYCKPQKYVGIWWCYHMKTATWESGPRHGATTENVKRYMDFAARNGFGGVLCEGWNPDWVTWDFNYTRPYDDFDIAEINRYGREKGVALIGHHETGGRVANYENQMEGGMQLFKDNGMHYVKTGYVGDLLDDKERHSSQFGVRHYRKVLETAAKYRLAVDNHEPVMPTGLQRTFPNLMTQEGVRGQEWNAWNPGGGNPPDHTVTLPFTRGLAGPMDFTPVIFRFENGAMPQTHPNTTLAKQLALFVILYSPLQMAADDIVNYERNPGPFQFIVDCPTDWDRTLYPEAEIGRYLTVARKAKGSDDWFLGSATGSESHLSHIDLSFLDPGCSYRAVIYRDGCDADWETNPYPVEIVQRDVTSESSLDVPLARGGGAAIHIFKLDKNS